MANKLILSGKYRQIVLNVTKLRGSHVNHRLHNVVSMREYAVICGSLGKLPCIASLCLQKSTTVLLYSMMKSVPVELGGLENTNR